jgi:hypothetical protein
MGHYQPKKELVMKSMPNVIFHKEHLTAKYQQEKLKTMKSSGEFLGVMFKTPKKEPFCQHLIKSLNEVTFTDEFGNKSKSPQRFKQMNASSHRQRSLVTNSAEKSAEKEIHFMNDSNI